MDHLNSDQRTFKNLKLTRRFHWPYFGGWLRLNIGLVLFVEALALYLLSSIDSTHLPLPSQTVVISSGVITLVALVALVALGRFSAHRIAGVHLRTERVLLELADGVQDVRLQFRSEDELEDVEAAFEAMLCHLRSSEPPSGAESTASISEEVRSDRRSWRNIQMTSRYHHKYMAIWMLLSLALLAAAYGVTMLLFYFRHYQGGSGPDPTTLTVLLTPFVVGAAGVIMWRGYLTAHRLAGVHVRLANVFQRIAQGHRDVELRFRSYDRLENLENAFTRLMKWITLRDSRLQ